MLNTNHGKILREDVDNFEGRFVNIEKLGTLDEDNMYKGRDP